MPKQKLHVMMLLVGAGVLVYACTANNTKESVDEDNKNITSQRQAEQKDLIAYGSYLTTVGGCNDCHSPKIFDQRGMNIDSTKMFSGHPANSPLPPPDKKALTPGQWVLMAPDVTAFVGPWGISFAANLTPDSTTGIGAWSEEVFIKTLRTGKHLGLETGRPILPPMPWYNFAQLKDEDLKAIYAFLRSVPPIINKVPAPKNPGELTAAN